MLEHVPMRYPHHNVVYGEVKAGPVVGTAAVKVPQQDVPGAEQLRVQHAPNMQRENDPVREVRGRVHDGIWVPRNQKQAYSRATSSEIAPGAPTRPGQDCVLRLRM